ncbi:MAG: hypothetical protein ACJAR1_002019, partial [Rubritalea sp.]
RYKASSYWDLEEFMASQPRDLSLGPHPQKNPVLKAQWKGLFI